MEGTDGSSGLRIHPDCAMSRIYGEKLLKDQLPFVFGAKRQLLSCGVDFECVDFGQQAEVGLLLFHDAFWLLAILSGRDGGIEQKHVPFA